MLLIFEPPVRSTNMTIKFQGLLSVQVEAKYITSAVTFWKTDHTKSHVSQLRQFKMPRDVSMFVK